MSLTVDIWRCFNEQEVSERALSHTYTSLYMQEPTAILNLYLYDLQGHLLKCLNTPYT